MFVVDVVYDDVDVIVDGIVDVNVVYRLLLMLFMVIVYG